MGFNTKVLAIKACHRVEGGGGGGGGEPPPPIIEEGGGACTLDAVANGITYAADNGAKVINLSLGCLESDCPERTTLENAVVYSWNAGALNVAAAGNYGTTEKFYPAAFTDVVQPVGASTQSDTRASFSTFGTWVNL